MTRQLTRYLATQADAHARAAAGVAATALGFRRPSPARPAMTTRAAVRPLPLGALWDPTLLDRLHAPLTRRHY